MKEYGNALHVRSGSAVLPEIELEAVRQSLRRSFEFTQREHPEWGLVDFEVRPGPVTPSVRFESCPLDATDDHSDCESCNGEGWVFAGFIEGSWDHLWGWYSQVGD